MNNNHQNQFNLFLAALIGGLAGAIVVYLSRETHRENIKDKFEKILQNGEEKGSEIVDKIDRGLKSGKKNLAKKIQQVEDQIMQA